MGRVKALMMEMEEHGCGRSHILASVTSWLACFFLPSLSQKKSSDSLVSPMNGCKGNENFSMCQRI